MSTLLWIAAVSGLVVAYLVRVHRMNLLKQELAQVNEANTKLSDKNYQLEMELSMLKISMTEQKSTLTRLKEIVESLKPKPKEEKPVDVQGYKGPKGKTAPATQAPTRQATRSPHRPDRVTDNYIPVVDTVSPFNPLSPGYHNQPTMRDDTPVHSSHRQDDTPSHRSSVCSSTDNSHRGGYESSSSYDSGSSSDSGSSGGGCD